MFVRKRIATQHECGHQSGRDAFEKQPGALHYEGRLGSMLEKGLGGVAKQGYA